MNLPSHKLSPSHLSPALLTCCSTIPSAADAFSPISTHKTSNCPQFCLFFPTSTCVHRDRVRVAVTPHLPSSTLQQLEYSSHHFPKPLVKGQQQITSLLLNSMVSFISYLPWNFQYLLTLSTISSDVFTSQVLCPTAPSLKITHLSSNSNWRKRQTQF